MFNNYINLFSGVAFLYQRFWNIGKKNSLFNDRANPNEETSKIKKKKKILLQRRWPENPETIWLNIFLQKTRDCLW